QCVKAPQEGHRVLPAVHGIIQKIEQQERRNKARPSVFGNRPRWQSQAQRRLNLRPDGMRLCEDERAEYDVEDPDAEIAEAPLQRRKSPLPSRSAELPPSDQEQTSE